MSPAGTIETLCIAGQIDTTAIDNEIERLNETKLDTIPWDAEIIPTIKEMPVLDLTIKARVDGSAAHAWVDRLCGYTSEQLKKTIAPINAMFNTTITPYAGGGFPSAGSLFIAGEAGPEFVGNIGGSTGVMNTDQMAAAMYTAMAAALSANPQGGGDIYLDGEVIYKNVVRRNNNHVRSVGRSALLT